MIKDEAIRQARDLCCKEFADLCAAISGYDETKMEEAVVAGRLLSAKEGESVSTSTLDAILCEAHEFQKTATLFSFLLAGAIEMDFQDGQLVVRAAHGSNDEMIKRLIEAGIAKPA